jgi:uncharacterized repeat protein (TIGR03833 family)
MLLTRKGFIETIEYRKRNKMSGKKRKAIKVGMTVKVVQKQDQGSGKLTDGTVKRILTNSATHPHGIKVMLESNIVGRVKEII